MSGKPPVVSRFIDLSAGEMAAMARPMLDALVEAAALEEAGDHGSADRKIVEAYQMLHDMNMALGFAAGRIFGGISRHRKP